jgi:hypothetical protein
MMHYIDEEDFACRGGEGFSVPGLLERAQEKWDREHRDEAA